VKTAEHKLTIHFGATDGPTYRLELGGPGAAAGWSAAGDRDAGQYARRRGPGLHPPVCAVALGGQAGDRGGGRSPPAADVQHAQPRSAHADVEC
jgi:hypothetical protein